MTEMPSLKQTDPIAYAISRAFDRDIARIAAAVGCSDSKVRSWRRGSLNVAPWIVRAIADVLRLNDAVVAQHHQCRRRQDEDREAQRERTAA